MPGFRGAHLTWLGAMSLAMASVFALNALIDPTTSSKWLWMLQAATPFATINIMGQLDAHVRPSSGQNIGVMTMIGSVLSVPTLALIYGILIACNALGAVFYVAILGKFGLWCLGHKCVLDAQLDVRPKKNTEEFELETQNLRAIS
jgi:hypothetical protein